MSFRALFGSGVGLFGIGAAVMAVNASLFNGKGRCRR